MLFFMIIGVEFGLTKLKNTDDIANINTFANSLISSINSKGIKTIAFNTINEESNTRISEEKQASKLNSIEMEIRRVDAISGVRMIFDFTEKGLSFRAEDTLISVGGLGIVNRNVCSFVIE